MPCAARELVDPVPGLAAEQPGEFAVPPFDQMDRQVAGTLGYPICVVAFRESRQEPRRVDAHLAGEADEAACLLIACACGNHEHRIVDQGDQLLERFRHCSVARVGTWPENMRPPTWSAFPT